MSEILTLKKDDDVFVIKIVSGELLVARQTDDKNYVNPYVLVWAQEKNALLLMPYPTPNSEMTKDFVILKEAVIGLTKAPITILDVYKEMSAKIKTYKNINPLTNIQ